MHVSSQINRQVNNQFVILFQQAVEEIQSKHEIKLDRKTGFPYNRPGFQAFQGQSVTLVAPSASSISSSSLREWMEHSLFSNAFT